VSSGLSGVSLTGCLQQQVFQHKGGPKLLNLTTHLPAVAGHLRRFVVHHTLRVAQREVNRANGFVGARATRAIDAAFRPDPVELLGGAFNHRRDHFSADGTMLDDDLGLDAQPTALQPVTVGDNPAGKPARGSGRLSRCSANNAARAGLDDKQALPASGKQLANLRP